MTIPQICHYCGGKVILTQATDIYEHGEGSIYLCTNCNAFVSCHKGTTRPMGRLANAVLRMKRREVHQIFDAWWTAQGMTRSGLPSKCTYRGGRRTSRSLIWNPVSRCCHCAVNTKT